MRALPSWLSLLLWLALCLGAGTLGGLFTAGTVQQWYPTLHKPSWNPPAWLFGPVWTALYLMMAVAAQRVGRRENPRLPLALFLLQLALNAAWSPIFFGSHSPKTGLAIIIVLIFAIAATMYFAARTALSCLL